MVSKHLQCVISVGHHNFQGAIAFSVGHNNVMTARGNYITNVLVCMSFLQFGAHSPLESKEPMQTHTHTVNRTA